eukprot:352938-Prymnesium_polylepis.1
MSSLAAPPTRLSWQVARAARTAHRRTAHASPRHPHCARWGVSAPRKWTRDNMACGIFSSVPAPKQPKDKGDNMVHEWSTEQETD